MTHYYSGLDFSPVCVIVCTLFSPSFFHVYEREIFMWKCNEKKSENFLNRQNSRKQNVLALIYTPQALKIKTRKLPLYTTLKIEKACTIYWYKPRMRLLHTESFYAPDNDLKIDRKLAYLSLARTVCRLWEFSTSYFRSSEKSTFVILVFSYPSELLLVHVRNWW